MSGSVYVARSSEVAAPKLGDEVMIMSLRDSTLFTLNEVATVIWETVDGSTSLNDIVDRHICPHFEVEASTALKDAESLAHQLARHGILLLSDSPIQPLAPTRQDQR